MPANKKHFSSTWQRLLKITAGFIGGFILTQSFFMIFIQFFKNAASLITLQFAGFIVWVALMIIAFLAKNGFKIWGIYLLLSAFFVLLIYVIP
ncbi:MULTISPECIES: hypothetical protein [Salegentibacter]|uniref:hypothetical protein n=1 Tax=Salegentibacter TaxID=143222 RepID=UPI00187B5895|nr:MULTISPECIES: hypothetical protein [Salegentibacter]MBE7641380.1 hypothetical protein [Salegentibacter sp. BLCTC]MBI6117684.1 hypothetical protein [Salegentibacter maritimus]